MVIKKRNFGSFFCLLLLGLVANNWCGKHSRSPKTLQARDRQKAWNIRCSFREKCKNCKDKAALDACYQEHFEFFGNLQTFRMSAIKSFLDDIYEEHKALLKRKLEDPVRMRDLAWCKLRKTWEKYIQKHKSAA